MTVFALTPSGFGRHRDDVVGTVIAHNAVAVLAAIAVTVLVARIGDPAAAWL
jgi:hypothetical protein